MIEQAAAVTAKTGSLDQATNQPVEQIAEIEPTRPPQDGDVGKFNHAMVSESDRVNMVSVNKPVGPVQEVSSSDLRVQSTEQADGRLGDKMLDGVERLRSESKQHINDIMVSLNDPNMSSSQMLKVVVDMNMWSMKQELLAKSAGGVDRSVDSLLKAQ